MFQKTQKFLSNTGARMLTKLQGEYVYHLTSIALALAPVAPYGKLKSATIDKVYDETAEGKPVARTNIHFAGLQAPIVCTYAGRGKVALDFAGVAQPSHETPAIKESFKVGRLWSMAQTIAFIGGTGAGDFSEGGLRC